MKVTIQLHPSDFKPDEYMGFQVVAVYRGREYRYDLIEKHDMVSTVFDRMVERARLEMKKMIQKEIDTKEGENDQGL